jgi:hypothetical protein
MMDIGHYTRIGSVFGAQSADEFCPSRFPAGWKSTFEDGTMIIMIATDPRGSLRIS